MWNETWSIWSGNVLPVLACCCCLAVTVQFFSLVALFCHQPLPCFTSRKSHPSCHQLKHGIGHPLPIQSYSLDPYRWKIFTMLFYIPSNSSPARLLNWSHTTFCHLWLYLQMHSYCFRHCWKRHLHFCWHWSSLYQSKWLQPLLHKHCKSNNPCHSDQSHAMFSHCNYRH